MNALAPLSLSLSSLSVFAFPAAFLLPRYQHLPAFQGIHELSRRIEAFPHERRLLAHCNQGILQQPSLILRGGGRSHCRSFLAGGGVA